MTTDEGCDKHYGTSLLTKIEQKYIKLIVPKIPKFIETNHLTLMTILWIILVLLFSYLATKNIYWLLGISFCILFHHITDLLDGALGRYRKTGLIKWGFYIDHLLDWMFICSIAIGYFMVFKESNLFIAFAVVSLYTINSYLLFGATNKFKIYYLKIGPSEIGILMIAFNTLLVFFGEYLGLVLPYIIILLLIIIIIIIYFEQKSVWNLDMIAKGK